MPLAGNSNLWSLGYEALYYLLFALIWSAGVRLRWWMLGALLIGAGGWPSIGLPRFLCHYAWGFLFWLSGLWLAWRTSSDSKENSNWHALALLGFATWKIHLLRQLLLGFHVSVPMYPAVTMVQLDFLPFAVLLLAAISNRRLPYRRVWDALAVLWPLMGLALTYAADNLSWSLSAAVWAAAIFLWAWKPSPRFFRWCAPAGLISYGLYATARPIQILVYNIANTWTGPRVFLWLAAAFLTLGVSAGVAWYLEKRVQPKIVRAVFR